MSEQTERCVALNSKGRRCRNFGGPGRNTYFGNPEFYAWDSPTPGWVTIILCPKHGPVPRKRTRKVVRHGR